MLVVQPPGDQQVAHPSEQFLGHQRFQHDVVRPRGQRLGPPPGSDLTGHQQGKERLAGHCSMHSSQQTQVVGLSGGQIE